MESSSKSGVKCLCCKELFYPSPGNVGRQRFCTKEPCRKARELKSGAQWRRKNRHYHRGPQQVARVQEWRRKNPDYGKGKKGRKQESPLQNSAPHQVPEDEMVTLKAGQPPSETLQSGEMEAGREPGNGAALQNFANMQLPLVVGLVVTVMGEALQNSVVPFTRRLVERGRRVLAANSDELGFMGAPQTTQSTPHHAHHKTSP